MMGDWLREWGKGLGGARLMKVRRWSLQMSMMNSKSI